MKFTKTETKSAMKLAMKIRKKASINLKCKFNDVSLSHCLKMAYKKITEKVKVVIESVKSYSFNQNEIGRLKNGWNAFHDICKDLNYDVITLGGQFITHQINCSKEDFKTIKEMILEV